MSGPAAFSFGTYLNQPLNTLIGSDETYIYDWTDGPRIVQLSDFTYTGVSDLEVRINGGAWEPLWGSTISNGDVIRLRARTAASFSTTYTVALTLGATTGTWQFGTLARDITPNALSFFDVSGAALSTQYVSNTVTISGINDTIVLVPRYGCEISKNGGAWSSTALAFESGDTLALRVTSAATTSTTVLGGVLVQEGGAGVPTDWAVTTAAVDTTPDAFTFTDASGVAASSVQTSNVITITGIAAAASVSFTTSGGSAHEYRKNGGAWTAVGATTVNNGDTLQVRLTAPASAGAAGNITMNVGGVADTYTVTTLTADTTPNAFTFVDQPSVAIGTVATSNVITITGIDAAAAVSFTTSGGSAHEYRKNSGAWTAVGATTVVNNDTLQVRHTVSGTVGQAAATTMTVGGVSDSFNTVSAAPDTTPDPFSFADVTGAQLSTSTASAPITVAGITGPASISIAGADGQYRINGGAWTSSSGTVANGDQVEVRLTSAGQYVTAINTVLTIGGVSDTFTVTTRSPASASQYVKVFRETVFGVAP
jgi:hypothetical protein